MDKDQDIALELVKNWLEENDANILLMPKEVIRWTSLDGSITNMGWRHDSLASIVTLIKGTIMPLPMMKYVDINFIISAGQETGRVFEAGVHVNGTCLPQYFNFNAKRRLGVIEKIVKRLLECALATGNNVDSKEIYDMINRSIDELGLEPISAQKRNTIIDSFRDELQFSHRYGRNRLSIRLSDNVVEKYSAIQHRRRVEVPVKPSEGERQLWMKLAKADVLN